MSETEPIGVKLTVNGSPIPIKKIVQDMLGGAVLGLVRPLKGVEKPTRVTIEIEIP